MRDWSDETFKQILPGATGTGSAVGPGPQGGHETQWAAIVSVSSKVGCSAETLRKWVRQAERDQGRRPGLTSEERERLKALERENLELRRANEILRKASAYFAQAELDRRPKS